ncbi:unnamed protein product [Parnassius apollo]|uniref:(apollo) hypothetical protein n=1 Tax=Parnassius apollo TaxID=110799 RepID=A0A8S3X8V1_PARAO|nr:unnamed protein product [Parnassius apollo]
MFSRRMKMLRGHAAPQAAEQLTHVDAAVDLPVVVDSDDDGLVSHGLENIRRGNFGNAPYTSRKSTLTPHTPKQVESGCRKGS